MAYSLGLKLYQLAHRREAAPEQRPARPPARPDGRLVWMHAPDADAARPLAELARRVMEEEGHPVLFTGPDGVVAPDGAVSQTPPADSPAASRAFLDHWQPTIAIFAEGEMRPSLMNAAADRGVGLMLVDGRTPRILKGHEGWWPGLGKATLSRFAHILTLDEAAARAFRRSGGANVKVAGRMEESSAPLPCTEAERAELARLIATRTVWLAAGLPEAEEEIVIAAHRSALRLSHRLLLIVVPENSERAAALAERLDAEGFTVARRALEEEPDPETEIYVADNPAEYGLWYRLAPVCYLGGTFTNGAIRDPMEAAALGSAILHGSKPGLYTGAFARLTAARATQVVPQPKMLGDALGDMLSPDRVAWLAGAAWGVVSDGMEVTDRVLALIQRMMDET